MADWELNGPRDGKYKDEAIRSVFLGKLFHFWEGRNAWWGTWSSIYPNAYSFHPELEEVQRRVETFRTQGTRWQIVELPALVFVGTSRALVAVEINTTNPLSDVRLNWLTKPTLTGFAELLRPAKRDSRWTFFTAPARMVAAQSPFLRYGSVSYGGSYPLAWTEVTEKNQLRGARVLLAAAKRRITQPARKLRPKTTGD